MRKSGRPAIVMLIGVAQILVGSTLLLSGGIGMASSAFGGSSATVTVNKGREKITVVYDTHEEMEKAAPGYKLFHLGTGVAGLLLALAMIGGACGLLLGRGWGWWLSVAWGVLGLAYQIGVVAYLWAVAMPATGRVGQAAPRDDAGVCGTLVNTNTFFHLGWAIFASAFVFYVLLILLFVLLVSPVRRWCSAAASDAGAFDDLESNEDDRPRRRRRYEEDRRRDDDEDDRPRRRRARDRDD